jgi:hypothetical protein
MYQVPETKDSTCYAKAVARLINVRVAITRYLSIGRRKLGCFRSLVFLTRTDTSEWLQPLRYVPARLRFVRA